MRRSHFLRGNTIRFEATFLDWNDDMVPVNPNIVKFRVLDSKYNEIVELVLGEDNRADLGRYFAHYAVDDVGYFVYEWYADIDGLPSVERAGFIVKEV